MADSEMMIASAVIIPETIDLPVDPAANSINPSLKRRQTDATDSAPDSNKRTRLSPDDRNSHEPQRGHESGRNARSGSPREQDGRPNRHDAGREEERKRGRRMFGALIGALSGSAATSKRGAGLQKRRAEIEKKAKEKMKLTDEEEQRKERESVEVVRRRRRRAQLVLDEEVMKTNHDNLLATARFLYTETEPRLYYKPWDLRDEEEDMIDRHIKDAEDQVDREQYAFDTTRRETLDQLNSEEQAKPPLGKDKRQEDTQIPIAATSAASPRSLGEDQMMKDDIPKHNAAEPPEATAEVVGKIETQPETDELDDMHHGETVFEAEEDTVIY